MHYRHNHINHQIIIVEFLFLIMLLYDFYWYQIHFISWTLQNIRNYSIELKNWNKAFMIKEWTTFNILFHPNLTCDSLRENFFHSSSFTSSLSRYHFLPLNSIKVANRNIPKSYITVELANQKRLFVLLLSDTCNRTGFRYIFELSVS